MRGFATKVFVDLKRGTITIHVLGEIQPHGGPLGLSPATNLRGNTMSVVTSVFAFL